MYTLVLTILMIGSSTPIVTKSQVPSMDTCLRQAKEKQIELKSTHQVFYVCMKNG